MSNSLRVSYSSDYTVAALDIINSTQRIDDITNEIEYPLILMASGQGIFESEYRIDTSDLLLFKLRS